MLKKIFKFLVLLLVLVMIFLFVINLYVSSFSRENYLKSIENLPKSDIGLVFGAAVLRNGKPSSVLADRLKIAFNAYKKGKIQNIVVSGYVSDDGYNEPDGMKKYLLDLGVKKEDIYLDEKGIDTYESISGIKNKFFEKKIVLFTQDFQLKRAIYIATRFDLDVYGVETNLRNYYFSNYFREVFARVKAVWEADILRRFN